MDESYPVPIPQSKTSFVSLITLRVSSLAGRSSLAGNVARDVRVPAPASLAFRYRGSCNSA